MPSKIINSKATRATNNNKYPLNSREKVINNKGKLESQNKKAFCAPKFKPSVYRPSLGSTHNVGFQFGELLKGRISLKVDALWGNNKASIGKTQSKQNIKPKMIQSPTITASKKVPNVSSVRNLNFKKLQDHKKELKKTEQRSSDIKVIVHKL